METSETNPVQGYDPERYLAHFGLVTEPFSLTPDPDFFYLSDGHADGLATLEIGVMERRGLTVLTGEVGTGKTTLAHSILAQWRRVLDTAYLSTGTFTFDDVLRKTLRQFGLPESGPMHGLLERLELFLKERAQAGKTVVLLIDEAQNLPPETLEQLRLLLNIETEKQKLLQLVLLGQPELEDRLRTHELRHIQGRVAVQSKLNALPPEDCRRYIFHRLNVAGDPGGLFTPRAMRMIVKASEGVPRRLNVLCHNALLFAYGRSMTTVDHHVAAHAINESGSTGTRAGVPSWLKMAPAMVVAAGLTASAFLWLPDLLDRSARDGVGASSESQAAAAQASPGSPEAGSEAGLDPNGAAGEPEPSQGGAASPPALGEQKVVLLREGETLSSLILEVYGRYEPGMLEAVLAANPDLRDTKRIAAGTAIAVPANPDLEQ